MKQSSFTKSARLSIIDHVFILLFIIGVLYISSVVYRLNLNTLIYAITAIYAILLFAMEYRKTLWKRVLSESCRYFFPFFACIKRYACTMSSIAFGSFRASATACFTSDSLLCTSIASSGSRGRAHLLQYFESIVF